MNNFLAVICLVTLVLMAPVRATAAFEVYKGESAMCTSLLPDLQRDWMQVRRHLVPLGSTLNRAKDEDFVCISNRAIVESRPTTSAGMSDLKCFKPNFYRGGGFCCDQRLRYCAALNPGLFPDLTNSPTQKDNEPQKSIWVKPPSESDQWKSN